MLKNKLFILIEGDDDERFFKAIINPVLEKILRKYRLIDRNDKIAVVIKEIESWYLAGLSDKDSKELTGKKFKNTNTIIKEQFYNLIPNRFDSRIDFMIEILKHFSVNFAKKKNTSFNYFMEKYTNI